MSEKMILDVTCANRSIWFQKHEPHTIYCDKRREHDAREFGKEHRSVRRLDIDPDVQCDFTDLPFEDDSFQLVVFDPPHKDFSQSSWMAKKYGSLEGDWKPMIRDGFKECMRVLRPGGVLIFKWAELTVSTREIIDVIGQEPLFGHRSGQKQKTHWLVWMKFGDEDRPD